MKNIFKFSLLIMALVATSCQGLVDDGINDNPNKITVDEIDAQLFLTGTMLANSVAQSGHLNRIAGMYSGQLTGLSSLYSNIYGYSISTAESVATWSRIYIGLIPNVRHIRNQAPNDALLQGICKVLEAHAIGTAANLFGDVPYAQVNTEEVDDPAFDGQVSVIDAAIALLNDAINDLNGASSRNLDEDIYYGGDAAKWMACANTLKARYYMHKKDYTNAYTSAENGIASAAGSMKHVPRGDASIAEGDKNLFWEILEGSRTGDIGSADSYLAGLLDPASATYRGNSKTDETARSGYSYVDETGGSNNFGIIEQFEPQNLVSFEENHLTLAEAGARSKGFDTGLQHLNEFRDWLNGGGRLNSNFSDSSYVYDAYEATDFDAGGMENADGAAADRALLREIIEERYVSCFGQFTPYDDARRLRKSDTDVMVPFPLNVSSASQHPERMPYSDDELNSNSNAPADDPGIFVKTAVNQ